MVQIARHCGARRTAEALEEDMSDLQTSVKNIERMVAVMGLVVVFFITGGPSGLVLAVLGVGALVAWRQTKREQAKYY
ncbi:MAG: hypothetical protein FWG11_09225 [Promicromonosporaceae bacterium]|nr:hypothetical protein [Promicromonosporaceae bacterium]